ncbi:MULTISPECIES: DUF5819 family protein [Streptomyces rochei group]|uniref:DUF5819 family protein n=1 Tax=Streptomyces plicatus TaxID=1922 RepID=A0ABW1Y0Q8_STRPL|nr:DUF5819 family protein [Streptomyces plicatus]GGZ54355.1 hypothetical protein GCM10010301_28900 [Streptomyces plicatus]
MDAYDTGSGARQGPGGREHPAGPGGGGTGDGTGGASGSPEGAAGPGAVRGGSGETAEPPPASGPAEPGPVRDAAESGPSAGTAESASGTAPATAATAEPVEPVEPVDLPTGVAALSPRYQVGALVALAVVAVAVCAHLGLVFLHVAPSNTLTKQHGAAVDEWVFPEFEQNWKLFAPNPLQQNISVQVRAEVSTADGEIRTTGWYDLSAEDGRAIDGNPVPSHTQQNELRRAWDFFVATHDSDDRAVGLRGTLSESYLRRIAVLRLERNDAAGPGGVVERVQYRSRTTNVEPPSWSGEKVSDRPTVRELPWWTVSGSGDPREGAA